MTGSDDHQEPDKSVDQAQRAVASADVISFPQSRVRPANAFKPFKDLGMSATKDKYDLPEEPTTGHWCSRCHGIWFGYLLEVECPVCGSRDG